MAKKAVNYQDLNNQVRNAQAGLTISTGFR